MTGPLFDKVTIVGFGLIGSSLARALSERSLAGDIVCADADADTCEAALELGLAAHATTDMAQAVADADLVMLCAPVGAYAAIGRAIAGHLKPGAIVSDVGSVKASVVDTLGPLLPTHVHFVPGHPIAGTEKSGPRAGFSALFLDRWCVLTPLAAADRSAVTKIRRMWERCGARVVEMDAAHHDRVLAITSHVPHLIAYTIVDTATQLQEDTQAEVIKFSAGGFRDFTRIAASDPVMWRDIFLNNRDAVLEMLQRFTEDLTNLQKAIRRGDGETLQEIFTRTRAVRRGIIEAKQSEPEESKIGR